MKGWRWQAFLAVLLAALSAALYLAHYAVFRDARHIWLYLLGDVAFLPVEVLLVVLVLHRLLERREKRSMLKKLNMVIGAFFSEVGTQLMERFRRFDRRAGELARELVIKSDWSRTDFARAAARLEAREPAVAAQGPDLVDLRDFLAARRDFLLRLLENPNLLEHEKFTELLWAVFHLTEELVCRRDLGHSPEKDLEHLAGDIKRAEKLLLAQWLAYMRHLRDDYPYLFSLAARTNPFNPEAAAEIRE